MSTKPSEPSVVNINITELIIKAVISTLPVFDLVGLYRLDSGGFSAHNYDTSLICLMDISQALPYLYGLSVFGYKAI